MNLHVPGAKDDGGKVKPRLVVDGFSRALLDVARVATYGAQKYTEDGWRSVPDGVDRYRDAMYRHLLAEAADGPLDPESGLLHAAHAAWNALARLELLLQEETT
jgi:hypothetical protein